ncbi:MAG: hypothetical protein WC528_02675 [Patescibacteria group bacterium]
MPERWNFLVHDPIRWAKFRCNLEIPKSLQEGRVYWEFIPSIGGGTILNLFKVLTVNGHFAEIHIIYPSSVEERDIVLFCWSCGEEYIPRKREDIFTCPLCGISQEDKEANDEVAGQSSGPRCPKCGRTMFPADEHGRQACLCGGMRDIVAENSEP